MRILLSQFRHPDDHLERQAIGSGGALLGTRRWQSRTRSEVCTSIRSSMSTTELDRSMLDGKDREELHAIAAAVGVKAPTRMRKAELVSAILEAF